MTFKANDRVIRREPEIGTVLNLNPGLAYVHWDESGLGDWMNEDNLELAPIQFEEGMTLEPDSPEPPVGSIIVSLSNGVPTRDVYVRSSVLYWDWSGDDATWSWDEISNDTYRLLFLGES